MQTLRNYERIKAYDGVPGGEHVPPGQGSLLKQLVCRKRSLLLGGMGWKGAGEE